MNIVFVLTRSDTVGGVQNHVVELAAALIKDGHIATVLCGGDGQYFEKLARYKVPSYRIEHLSNAISIGNDVRARTEIVNHLKKLSPDIVSTHSTKAGLVGRLACRKLGIPVLFTAHGWAYTDGVGMAKQAVYKLLERWLARMTNHIICVSEFDRQLAIKAGIDEARLTTVHNGRLDEWSSELVLEENSIPIINMIGRLDKQKDHVTLFHALKELKKDYSFRVVLLGDGPHLRQYQQLVSELGIEANVEFKGLVQFVHAELRQSDIFVLITHYEGFPRSTLEAMCAGLPVVVSDAGGSAEAVNEGVTGYVVERGNVGEVVQAVGELLSDREKREQMGKNARALYLERFTFAAMYAKTLQVYEHVLVTLQK